MKTNKSIFVIAILIVTIASCQPAPTQTPTANVQVTNVIENEIVTGEIKQTKSFNQCESSSVFKSDVQFSDSSSRTDQQQLMLGAEISGGVELPSTVKVQITGSIQKHFTETQGQSQGHTESANIEVPAHTQQEYTITWRETRRNGMVEYVEAGETKTTEYSYRIGLELISATGRDIPCNQVVPTSVPSDQLSSAVQVVDLHFKSINNAKDRDELVQSWNLMTTNLQCNPSDQCQFNNFQNWWWQWHVAYEIYDCNPGTVIVRYSLAPRNEPFSTSATIFYERYTLVGNNGNLKIDKGQLIDGVDNGCISVIRSE